MSVDSLQKDDSLEEVVKDTIEKGEEKEDEGLGFLAFTEAPWFLMTMDAVAVIGALSTFQDVAQNTQYYFFFAGLTTGQTVSELFMISNKYLAYYPH